MAKTFGKFIDQKRKELNMSQKELASRIKKENGESISPQYLNDIEHGRRHPSSGALLEQFANVLEVSFDYLQTLAGRLPKDIDIASQSPEKVDAALEVFRKTLRYE